MIWGLISMIAANAAVVLGAWATAKKVAIGRPWLDAAVFWAIRLTFLSSITIAAGFAGILGPTALGVGGLLVSCALLRRGVVRWTKPRLSWAWIPLGLVLARLVAQVWVFSPYAADALSYHLPKVAEWTRAGSFTSEMGVHSHVTFPAGFELVEAWWVVFLRHDILIEMAGVEFLILGALFAGALAEAVGLSRSGSMTAGLLFSLVPGMHIQATSCLNDAPVAALVVAAFALVASGAPRVLLVWIVGVGLGVKPTFAYAMPGVVALAWILRRSSSSAIQSRRWATALAVLGTSLGLVWYVRNAVVFGNPLHPVGREGLIDVEGGRWIQLGADGGSFLANLGALFGERIFADSWTVSPTLAGAAGWGWLVVGVGLPAAAWLSLRNRIWAALGAGFCVSLLGILLLVAHDPWFGRFTLFLPAIGCVAAAALAERRKLAWGLVVPLALAQYVSTAWPAELGWPGVRALAATPWRERSIARSRADEPWGEAVVFLGANSGEPYALYGPDYSRRVIYVRAETPDEFRRDLVESGALLLYAWPGTGPQRRILDAGLQEGWLRPSAGRRFTIKMTETRPP